MVPAPVLPVQIPPLVIEEMEAEVLVPPETQVRPEIQAQPAIPDKVEALVILDSEIVDLGTKMAA